MRPLLTGLANIVLLSEIPTTYDKNGDRQVNAGQTVALTATAQDAQGDSISYQWQQLTGSSVGLLNAQTFSASFVAPSASGSLSFRVTATDNRGASSSDDITITVVTLPPDNIISDSGSGGSSTPLMLLALALLSLRWRLAQ